MAHADDHKRARVYIQLSALDDHYIPHYSGMQLMDAMHKAPHTKAELRMLEGGHVTAILWHSTRTYIQAIVDAARLLQTVE